MTEDRVQIPCFDEKEIDGKRKNYYRRWLELFKQYTKRKEDVEVIPSFKEGTTNEKTGKQKKRKYCKMLFGHWDTEQQIKQHDPKTNRTGQNQNEQITQVIQETPLVKKTNTIHENF